MNLTPLEQKALAALQVESSANGHDFGIMECVEWGGSRRQLGGLVTSLQAKGVFEEINEPYAVNGDRKNIVTQYVLASPYQNEVMK